MAEKLDKQAVKIVVKDQIKYSVKFFNISSKGLNLALKAKGPVL